MAKSKSKRKKKNQEVSHREIKGFILLASSILCFLSFLSFMQNDPSFCWLGYVGYITAYSVIFLLGWGAYFIPLYMSWIGWKFLTQEKIRHFSFRSFCFFGFLLSLCFLLNAFAEGYASHLPFLKNHVFTETLSITTPYSHTLTRYNLGGVPFYYLYHDLPYLNLQQLLSNTGVVIIFSLLGTVFFLLFSGLRMHHVKKASLALKNVFLIFWQGIKGILSVALWIVSLGPKLWRRYKNHKKQKLDTIKVATLKIKSSTTPTMKTPYSPPIETKAKPSLSPKIEVPITNVLGSKSTEDKKKKSFYELPCSSLLANPPPIDMPLLKKELQRQAEILEATLKSFGIEAHVGEINCGPTITSFELHPAIGVKVQKIKALENDIALNLQAKSIRIIAPIPGKAAVGVEIPSIYPQQVSLKEMLMHYQQIRKKYHVPLLLGKTVTGDYLMADLTRTPHLLIAGATGSGKSVCINTIVMSIIMNLSPEDVRLLMIDPKKVELTQYSSLPHMIAPVITEAHGAYAALQWLVKEMQTRYDILKQLKLRNISAFNSRKIHKDIEEALDLEVPEKMPLIIAIIDEFADLMMVSSSDLETPIARIAQMARAVGIHLILATQRPSREVITGIIKANFPCRIAFKVASRINSQIIIDETGAESLLGNGDLLFLPPGTSHMVRAQGAYISDDDINTIISTICRKSTTSYLIPSFDAMKVQDMASEASSGKDQLYDQALSIVLTTRNASTTFLQRKLKIGYARAASLMDELEANKIIGPQEGSKPRRILFSSQNDLI